MEKKTYKSRLRIGELEVYEGEFTVLSITEGGTLLAKDNCYGDWNILATIHIEGQAVVGDCHIDEDLVGAFHLFKVDNGWCGEYTGLSAEGELIGFSYEIYGEHPQKVYPENILKILRQEYGLEYNNSFRDDQFNLLSPDEVFQKVCNWEGLVNQSTRIKGWVNDIYGVDISEFC